MQLLEDSAAKFIDETETDQTFFFSILGQFEQMLQGYMINPVKNTRNHGDETKLISFYGQSFRQMVKSKCAIKAQFCFHAQTSILLSSLMRFYLRQLFHPSLEDEEENEPCHDSSFFDYQDCGAGIHHALNEFYACESILEERMAFTKRSYKLFKQELVKCFEGQKEDLDLVFHLRRFVHAHEFLCEKFTVSGHSRLSSTSTLFPLQQQIQTLAKFISKYEFEDEFHLSGLQEFSSFRIHLEQLTPIRRIIQDCLPKDVSSCDFSGKSGF